MSDTVGPTLLTLLVSEESEGDFQSGRLDKFLAEELEERCSREQIKRLIQQGHVQVNGSVIAKPAVRLKEGDIILLEIPEAQPIALEAEPIALEVVYEDDALLVVNKPRGMLTHPTGREQQGTLVNALLHHCHGQLSGINGLIRPGIVHRLDRDTSGLLMVAKTDQAHRHLSEQLKAKTARRQYRAVVQGSFTEEQGTVDAPIGRDPRHRDKMAIVSTGRPAVTHWKVIERIHDKFALMELRLETGRTHQIRVHLTSIGHPIVGDVLYGSGIEKIWKLNTQGQLLQAFRLRFVHPATQAPLTFEIPMDPIFEPILHVLRETGSLTRGEAFSFEE